MPDSFKNIAGVIFNPRKLTNGLKRRFYYFLYKNKFGTLGKGASIKGKIWLVGGQNIFIGTKCSIGPYCRIESYNNYNGQILAPKLAMGSFTSLQHAVHIYCANSVTIGEGVVIASGCMITDNNHGIDPEGDLYLRQPLKFRSTTIEDGVWLGENVCVLGGAYIGKRSIIGSNSVVSGIIPSFSIAVGNPAKVIKQYNFESKLWEKV
ncbi:acyltransferase [Mucilaginibacter sp. KACC 22773]|uniref:acyltransferase n=1 Tax=Mucilaginibacter sp. KACC 22773 TaxID=3025671 RepID=UPI0023663B03|nr:acyltransferase [Mucilaginibacter sp. KACC 22773]WDF79147.1 acyltransferase [Mucilaginibacter sp. KACC 22773]